jgi:ABC-2 type transport system permease protein
MELYLFTHALRDFLRFRRFAAWLFLIVLCGVIGFAWPHLVGNREPPRQQYADLASMLAFHLVPLAAAIMVTSIIGQEVEQKTIVYLLTRPVSRWKLLLMRYLAACVAVSIVGVATALVLSCAIFHNPFHNDLLMPDVLAIVFGSFAYGALFMMISLLVVKSMIPCMIFFVWELSIPNLQGDIYRLSIFSYMQGIAQHPVVGQKGGVGFLTGSLSDNLLLPSTGYSVLGIGTVVLTLCALAWFTKFEYVPREDAD